jgi:hypothetical protein
MHQLESSLSNNGYIPRTPTSPDISAKELLRIISKVSTKAMENTAIESIRKESKLRFCHMRLHGSKDFFQYTVKKSAAILSISCFLMVFTIG